MRTGALMFEQRVSSRRECGTGRGWSPDAVCSSPVQPAVTYRVLLSTLLAIHVRSTTTLYSMFLSVRDVCLKNKHTTVQDCCQWRLRC